MSGSLQISNATMFVLFRYLTAWSCPNVSADLGAVVEYRMGITFRPRAKQAAKRVSSCDDAPAVESTRMYAAPTSTLLSKFTARRAEDENNGQKPVATPNFGMPITGVGTSPAAAPWLTGAPAPCNTQLYEYDVGVFVHVPVEAVNVCPTCNDPEITGRTVFAGAPPGG